MGQTAKFAAGSWIVRQSPSHILYSAAIRIDKNETIPAYYSFDWLSPNRLN